MYTMCACAKGHISEFGSIQEFCDASQFGYRNSIRRAGARQPAVRDAPQSENGTKYHWSVQSWRPKNDESVNANKLSFSPSYCVPCTHVRICRLAFFVEPPEEEGMEYWIVFSKGSFASHREICSMIQGFSTTEAMHVKASEWFRVLGFEARRSGIL